MSPLVAQVSGGTARPGLKPVVQRREPVPVVGPGEVVFVSDNPTLVLRLRLGDGPATPSGGVGGFVDVDREGRKTALEWAGISRERLPVPVLLDGLYANQSVEGHIAALTAMARPPEGSGPGVPPSPIRVGGQVPHGGKQWVIEDIEWGKATYRDMRRVRMVGTIVRLVEWDDPELLTVKDAGPTGAGSRGAKTYTVRSRDTLGTIARDQLGASTSREITQAVRAIKKLNGLRDSKALKPGMKLKLPTAEQYATKVSGTAGAGGAFA